MRVLFMALLAGLVLLGSGCEIRKRMYDSPYVEEFEASSFFSDGVGGARHPVSGTVARGELRLDDHYYQGKDDAGNPVVSFPEQITIDAAALERGRERYNIYCSVCHGHAGHGDGMVVQRGYQAPPSYHSDALRQMPVGYFFQVSTNGKGVMAGYADQVPVEDRWKIVAYIKALQKSQANGATVAFAPAPEQQLAQSGDEPR